MHTYSFLIHFREPGVFEALFHDNNDHKTIVVYTDSTLANVKSALAATYTFPTGGSWVWADTGSGGSVSPSFTISGAGITVVTIG